MGLITEYSNKDRQLDFIDWLVEMEVAEGYVSNSELLRDTYGDAVRDRLAERSGDSGLDSNLYKEAIRRLR